MDSTILTKCSVVLATRCGERSIGSISFIDAFEVSLDAFSGIPSPDPTSVRCGIRVAFEADLPMDIFETECLDRIFLNGVLRMRFGIERCDARGEPVTESDADARGVMEAF